MAHLARFTSLFFFFFFKKRIISSERKLWQLTYGAQLKGACQGKNTTVKTNVLESHNASEVFPRKLFSRVRSSAMKNTSIFISIHYHFQVRLKIWKKIIRRLMFDISHTNDPVTRRALGTSNLFTLVRTVKNVNFSARRENVSRIERVGK